MSGWETACWQLGKHAFDVQQGGQQHLLCLQGLPRAVAFTNQCSQAACRARLPLQLPPSSKSMQLAAEWRCHLQLCAPPPVCGAAGRHRRIQ